MKSFGTDFIVISDVYQPLLTLSKTSSGKPYYHLATVARGFKEYMAYLDVELGRVWIEEVKNKEAALLSKIESDNEFLDIQHFLFEKKLLEVGSRKEISLSRDAAHTLFGSTV